ncbi:branched-chain amino acid ABC transporter permease [Actinoplanes teichomyceticus]|uniref:Amino acid/amide ABC transporter membrane protein 1 (HAAT family) n=1 Tax=Actinoplanes teichomyceticus TaxID=1867 RepID=A0A561WBQ0_ACTTI|nr:branched-chain amino acid ABC transporter permease [Actinoplanes teichomyceticus]TWG21284.1 amino acid/amide ABC transporter membrane protein 1 (HAAT family) [Actinoplanes teichomyceticus]GIF16703.1 branched-chain amino acid ABC transporter permease [Actinoplanes teichomyceticus]
MAGADVAATAVLNGLAVGLLLFLTAAGLSLIFGMMDVLNLAHGSLFLAGAYLAWWVGGDRQTWPSLAAAAGAAVLVGILGGAVLALLAAPLARRSHLEQALLTLGVALIAGDLFSALFGDDVRATVPPPGLDGTITVAGWTYPRYRLVLVVVGAVLAAAVYWTVERTLLGALFRATVADRDMVAAIGMDPRRARVAAFALGAVLATLAGLLGAPIYHARPGLDLTILVLALVVVVVGGLGTVRGPLLAALLFGQVESVGQAVLPEFASFLLFGALAAVLVVRPRGLFGAATAGAAR